MRPSNTDDFSGHDKVLSLATTTTNAFESLIAVLILALVHLFVKELGRLSVAARNALLSAGAGASLAYVLLRILPKLAEKQESLLASADTGLRGFLEHHVYLVAMIGLVLYHRLSLIASYGSGAERGVATSRYRSALTVTLAGYGAYSALIGYLVVNRQLFGLLYWTLITLGLGTLFLVSDHGLRKKWPHVYDSWIRWILAGSLLVGWAIGVWVKVSPNVVTLWFAFLAGVMLVSTIGEKLSIEGGGSFWPFLAGALFFTVLLLLLEQASGSVL